MCVSSIVIGTDRVRTLIPIYGFQSQTTITSTLRGTSTQFLKISSQLLVFDNAAFQKR